MTGRIGGSSPGVRRTIPQRRWQAKINPRADAPERVPDGAPVTFLPSRDRSGWCSTLPTLRPSPQSANVLGIFMARHRSKGPGSGLTTGAPL